MRLYKTLICVLIFLLLPFIFFWDGNLPPNLIENGDGLFYYFSEQVVSAKILKAGELPLWDPYRFCGFPLIGDLQTGCLYPPNLLFLVLPLEIAFNWVMYLHYSLAGILTFCYMRTLGARHISSLFTGIAYMFSGFLVARMGHVNLQNTVVWVPLVFLCIEKIRQGEKLLYIPLGMLSVALQILAGFPQGALYTALYILIYIGFFCIITNDLKMRKRLVLSGTVILAGGVLLSLVQILPTLELSSLTPRRKIEYGFFTSNSLEPQYLPALLFPNIFGGASHGFYPIYYWGDWNMLELTGYCGILTLCLAGICFFSFKKDSRHVLFWSIAAITAFCLSLGKYNPLYKLTYFIPVYNRFRCPARHLFMFDFSLAVLGGMCLNFILQPGVLSKIRRSLNLAIGCGIAVSIVMIVFIMTFRSLNHSANEILLYNFSFRNPAIYIPLLTIGGTMVFLLMLKISKSLKLLVGLAPLLIFIDLFFVGHFFNEIWKKDAGFYETVSGYDSIKYLLNQKDINSYRIISPSIDADTPEALATLFPNSNILCNIKSVNGHSSFILDNYSRLLGMGEVRIDDFDWLLANNRILSFLNVKYIISSIHRSERTSLNGKSADFISDGTYVNGFENEYLTIFENTKALPRFNLVHKIRSVQDASEAIHILRDSSKPFNPKEEALVECEEAPLLLEEGSSNWSVIKNRYNETTIQTSSAGNKLLVVSESYYPGWKVYINGKEDKIFRVNGILRGVFVPRGNHIIRMVYDPLSFKIGLVISGLAWIGLVMWFIIILGRRKFQLRHQDEKL